MKIAIVGAGNVGRALATSFTRAGHEVVVTSRDPQHASDLATTVSRATTAPSPRAAAEGADIVVLAIPFSSAADVAADIRSVVAGKPVVDVTNRMSFGSNGADMDTSTSNAEELAELLPGAHVIKAFNTLFSSSQSDPVLESVRLDGFVAGDDEVAKSAVIRLVDSIGLNPVDVGPLARARQLEGLAFLNIVLQVTHNGTWKSGWKLVGAPATVADAA
ncbi:MAG TPA: NADPH-dependent F420 reductase [Candidatus Limnocylindrales bacterium]